MTLSMTATEAAPRAPLHNWKPQPAGEKREHRPRLGIPVAKGSAAHTSSGLTSSPAVFLPPPGI